jgi:MFS family permease
LRRTSGKATTVTGTCETLAEEAAPAECRQQSVRDEEGVSWLSPSLVLWGLQFLGGLASAPVYALLAIYVEEALKHTPLYTASLRSIQLALGGLSAPLAGALADRLGYKAAYVWGMTSTVAACAVFLTGQPLALGLLFLYSGLVGSLQTTAGQAYLMEVAGRARLGRASAGYFLGYTLGTSLGSWAAGAFLGVSGGARAPGTVQGVQGITDGFGVLGALTTLVAIGLIVGALWLLPRLARSDERSRTGRSFMISREMLARREIRLLLAIRFLPTCYWGAITLLIPLLLFRLTGSAESAGSYAGLSLALAAACQIWTGRVCDRAGVWLPVLIAPVGITLSAVGLALGARSVGALWGYGILGACAAWSLSTTMPLLIDSAARSGEKGRVVGLTALAWSAGMLTGNLVAGALASGPLSERWPGLPFALAALCGLGTAVLAVAIVGGSPHQAEGRSEWAAPERSRDQQAE